MFRFRILGGCEQGSYESNAEREVPRPAFS